MMKKNGTASKTAAGTVDRQNQRLGEIRQEYERVLEDREPDKLTPEQWAEADRRKMEDFLRNSKRRGVPDDKLQLIRDSLLRSNSMIYGVKKDKKETANKIVECKWWNEELDEYITITTESCRHWRTATVDDDDKVVFLTGTTQFGSLNWIQENNDEELEDVSHTGIVDTFDDQMYHRYSHDDCFFDDVLIVPVDILNGVKNEAPPGKRFSGREVLNSTTKAWSPAPDRQGYLLWDSTKGGEYLDDKTFFTLIQEFYTRIDINQDLEKYWNEFGCMEYWCPVSNRFLSEGERRRQDYWFHNGNGSARQRYYYSQAEMLDMYGGLDVIPVSMQDVVLMVSKVKTADQLLDEKLTKAENDGKVISIE